MLYIAYTPGTERFAPSVFTALSSGVVEQELPESLESQQAQPAADRGTQAAPDPKGLYLTAQVMTLTVLFPVRNEQQRDKWHLRNESSLYQAALLFWELSKGARVCVL